MTTAGSEGPRYPLSREEFRRALTTGHGRARIHAQRFGVAEFREEILEAATVCKVYDLQVNGARADWLVELCLAAGIADTIVALSVPGDPDDRNQRSALLLALAQRGVHGAREALYANWGPGHYSDFYATDEIVELDGDAGLLFVARELGRKLLRFEPLSLSCDEFWKYDESRSEGAARERLAQFAESDALARAYLDALQREDARAERVSARPDRPRKSVEQVLEAIRHNTQVLGCGWVRGWAFRASREELGLVLGTLLTPTNPRALEAGLRCLGGGGLPPLDPRIFELTRHDDDDVRYWAARVLSYHSLSGVRACGLEALARGDLIVAHEILTRSAQVDDADALVATLVPGGDPDEEHAICSGLLDVLKHSPEVRDPRLALHVYERTPCAHCRERSIEFLHDWRAIPGWLTEECAYDCNENIRALVARRDPEHA